MMNRVEKDFEIAQRQFLNAVEELQTTDTCDSTLRRKRNEAIEKFEQYKKYFYKRKIATEKEAKWYKPICFTFSVIGSLWLALVISIPVFFLTSSSTLCMILACILTISIYKKADKTFCSGENIYELLVEQMIERFEKNILQFEEALKHSMGARMQNEVQAEVVETKMEWNKSFEDEVKEYCKRDDTIFVLGSRTNGEVFQKKKTLKL